MTTVKLAAVMEVSTLELGRLYPFEQHEISGTTYYRIRRGDASMADPFIPQRAVVIHEFPEDPAAG